MKKQIILILCLCIFLCGCAPTFSAENGPVLDKTFIDSFPFRASSFDTVVDWFETHNKYKVERTDELNRDVYVAYNGNVDWSISAGKGYSGVYGVDGYYVRFTNAEEYSEEDWRAIYNSVFDELTDLCGKPAKVWSEGDCAAFYYGNLRIVVSISSSVMLDMYYEA